MAEKKSKNKIEEKVEETKEKEEIKKSKTEDTKINSEEEKVEETKEKTEVEESKTKEKREIEDKTESDAKTESGKTEEADGEKSDKVTEDKDEEKSKEKKSLKDKILKKKESGKEKDIETSSTKKEIAADENKDGYVSAREVVNSLDEGVKIVEKSEDEILANHVAEQLRENQDYFIFRIRKSIALVMAGLTVILLWMIPLSSYLKKPFNLSKLFNKNESLEQIASPTPSPTPEVEKINIDRIRIKIEKETEKVASISSLLKNNGYSEIDVLEAEVKEDGINVAVKRGSDELREKLMLVLKDEYSAGSSSSELTDDSDFSAVILIGK